eukprot:s2968_g7.t1
MFSEQLSPNCLRLQRNETTERERVQVELKSILANALDIASMSDALGSRVSCQRQTDARMIQIRGLQPFGHPEVPCEPYRSPPCSKLTLKTPASGWLAVYPGSRWKSI